LNVIKYRNFQINTNQKFMSAPSGKTRRSFIKKALGTAIATGAAPFILSAKENYVIDLEPRDIRKYGANDKVNIGVIGMGIMGFNNLETTLKVPGVKLIGV
jgi:hypothetical protein